MNTNIKKDTQAPIFVEFKTPEVSSSSATLYWITDEPATAQIDYGTSTDMQQLYITSDFSKSHSVDLDELFADALYYFKITACDKNKNCNQITGKTFTTLKRSQVQTAQVQTGQNI